MGLRGQATGKVQLSPDGGVAYIAFADGWVASYDLRTLQMGAAYRTGASIGALALSHDGKWLAVATESPHALIVLNQDLHPMVSHASETLDGRQTSRITYLKTAAPRSSFIVGQGDIAELWEISYSPLAEPIHDGLVHDYRMGESIAKPGFLGIRRTPLDQPLDVIVSDGPRRHVLAMRRQSADQPEAQDSSAEVINLDIRRRITAVPLTAKPVAGSGVSFRSRDRELLASTTRFGKLLQITDPVTWRIALVIDLPDAGQHVITHANVHHLWVGTASIPGDGPQSALTLINKDSLKIDASVRESRLSLGPMAFSSNGRKLAAIAGGKEGAILVYDTISLLKTQAVRLDDPLAVFSMGRMPK